MFTDKSEDDVNSPECSAEKVVDSDFCSTDENYKSDTNNTVTKGQNEGTPKEDTSNCESSGNKIADYTPSTLDEKTKSDKHEKNDEFGSNFHSVDDANKNGNESMRTNIHHQDKDEIKAYQHHVSKSKKENESNSKNNLQVKLILCEFFICYIKAFLFRLINVDKNSRENSKILFLYLSYKHAREKVLSILHQ